MGYISVRTDRLDEAKVKQNEMLNRAESAAKDLIGGCIYKGFHFNSLLKLDAPHVAVDFDRGCRSEVSPQTLVSLR